MRCQGGIQGEIHDEIHDEDSADWIEESLTNEVIDVHGVGQRLDTFNHFGVRHAMGWAEEP